MGNTKSQHQIVSTKENHLVCNVCQKVKPIFQEIADQHYCRECYTLMIIKPAKQQHEKEKKKFQTRIKSYQEE